MKRGNVNIEIATDGSRTVVEAAFHTYLHHSITATASSSRERGDKSDKKIGEALAVARALRKIADKLEHEARGTMKHREDCKKHAEEIAEAKKGLELQESLKSGYWSTCKPVSWR